MKRLRDALVWVAGGALLLAMVVDTTAMLGRQLHWPLLGAIEIVQAAVLFGSAGALLLASLEHSHARVHLLLDRLSPLWQGVLSRAHALAALLFHAGLLAGSAWLAIDLWNGREESELLRIPYRPLRIAVVLVLLALLLDAARRLLRKVRP
ncbi:MAG TPA: TRAP transporter small permease subunit [Steroidobacteraceae bacterium]|nr:TRAP transporter small permease subunit [Steroidobacteraceae bacterium]